MKIKKLVIFWFWNYKKEVEIDFSQLDEKKAYCLVTWENWVGKSMLFELIVNCLTSTWRVSNLKELANQEVLDSWKDCFVKLHLDDEKWSEYVIEKIVENKNLSLYIEFYRIDKNWNVIYISRWNKESRKAIEEFIQIDSNSIYDSIYSSQWELLSFFNRTPDEARRIIMNLLWTEQYLDKSKTSFSIARSLNSRLKELEEERWIKIEETEDEINEKIKNNKKDILELEQKEKNKKLLNEIKEDDFEFDSYISIKNKYENTEIEEIDEEQVEKEWKENVEKIKKLQKDINDLENNIQRKKELKEEISNIEEKIKKVNKDNKEIKDIEKLEVNKNDIQKIIEEKKNKNLILENNKNQVKLNLEKKKKEYESFKESISNKSKDNETLNISKEIIEKWEIIEEDIIDSLKENIEWIKKDKERISEENAVKKSELKKLEDLLESWNTIICQCCNSIVSKENIEHYRIFIKENLKDSSKVKDQEEENKKIIKKIDELKKETSLLEKEILDIDDLIKFSDTVIEYNWEIIKLKKIEEEFNELNKEDLKNKSISQLEIELKEIEEEISIQKEIKMLNERKEEFIEKMKLIIDLIWDKNIEDLKSEEEKLEKYTEELREKYRAYRRYKELKNEYQIQKLKYEKISDRIKNYSWKEDINEDNFKEIYNEIIQENTDIDFSNEIEKLEKEIKEKEKLLIEIERNREINKKIDFLSKEKMQYEHLWEVYDYIAKELYKKALPVIKNTVNDKLNISSKWKYQFHIETEKDWKEVFIPKIHLVWDTLENSRSVNTLSWWEATWVATALREAFTLLASKRSWFQWSFWVFDETFWNQDWEHLDSLIEALMKNSFLKQVFLITHDNEAKDKIRMLWWQELTLYKDEDWSTQVKFTSY